MSTPLQTRLKYIKSKEADELSEFVNTLPYRIEIKSLVWNGEFFYLWYVPPDGQSEIQPNVDLDSF